MDRGPDWPCKAVIEVTGSSVMVMPQQGEAGANCVKHG